MSKLSPEALKSTLDTYIAAAQEDRDHNTILWVQTILWIIDTEKSLKEVLDKKYETAYLTLEKNTEKSKGKIVFPSGTVDRHEVDKQWLNANGLIMAAMRELSEETFWLVKISPDRYIDTYVHKIWNIDEHRKLLQFRLLAYVYKEELEDVVNKFDARYIQEEIKKPQEKIEHRACHIVRCTTDAVCSQVFDKKYNFMDSTKLSIIEHSDHIRLWYYQDV